jgi:hypothetical protein
MTRLFLFSLILTSCNSASTEYYKYVDANTGATALNSYDLNQSIFDSLLMCIKVEPKIQSEIWSCINKKEELIEFKFGFRKSLKNNLVTIDLIHESVNNRVIKTIEIDTLNKRYIIIE